MLGDQIAFTVGHGALGTFELMNYHLLHIKCHCTFTPLEEDEFSISDFFYFFFLAAIAPLSEGHRFKQSSVVLLIKYTDTDTRLRPNSYSLKRKQVLNKKIPDQD